jgi:hypothetical protein
LICNPFGVGPNGNRIGVDQNFLGMRISFNQKFRIDSKCYGICVSTKEVGPDTRNIAVDFMAHEIWERAMAQELICE